MQKIIFLKSVSYVKNLEGFNIDLTPYLLGAWTSNEP